jgi:hypothetical protein
MLLHIKIYVSMQQKEQTAAQQTIGRTKALLVRSQTPFFHTATAGARANALKITSTILIELGNLQYFRLQLTGTSNIIKNLLVGLQSSWVNGVGEGQFNAEEG